MAHGSEDWKAAKPTATIFTVDDMGELAVRLGSPVSFDRRGNVIWFDDFEYSLNKWQLSTDGANSTAAISNERARTGALSCKLVTDDSTGDHIHIAHDEPYLVLSKLGFEFSLTTDDEEGVLIFYLEIFTGTHYHYAGIKYDMETEAWWYINAAGVWASFSPAGKVVPEERMFNTLKLVIDPDTQKYVRLICNNVEYDMSALSYYYTTLSQPPFLGMNIRYETPEDASKTAYVDDVILTQNEP